MRELRFEKLFLLFLLWMTVSCSGEKKKEIELIRSNAETITYYINEEAHPTWGIVPEAKPDRLHVECIEEETEVAFVTDIDSISFKIKVKDTVQFYVLLKEKDSALTEIVGIPKNANFSDAYIEENQGKFKVEVPEVHELVNIMVAISEIGQVDANMTDLSTEYHQEVLDHFLPYKDHAAMDTINALIAGPLEETGFAPIDSYWNYYSLKMNACGYLFNDEGAILDDGIIHKMGFDNPGDLVKEHKPLLEDFAKVSGFRQFYKDHKPYYEELISIYKSLNPIDKMQEWLEAKFPIKYGNYRVTFSPLVGGAHSTNKFKDNGFEQTVMFICRAQMFEEYNEAVNEMIQSRVVFTEIDHNFVNPISDKYLERIEEVMGEREEWVNPKAAGTEAYSNSYSVFNEYMTFAIFSAYCLDKFSQADQDAFIPLMEEQMEKGRGFIRFKDFNQKLVELYKEDPDRDIHKLYEAMFDWCAAQ
ncbi:DUF4932 domain-containing protein [Leptobacterium flavescens]|uniref:DUF4932 domain-containing protein n=1 Tax=Leptobacterium flavescens TaxID=472055 RepID=A0A6P0UFP5_9FLAO|nr:DUF4932 domain-containing protein [Leptobacterium flavescens]NER12084.1 DUF4932 domain-containing protein [Leptobacterium flavescens]